MWLPWPSSGSSSASNSKPESAVKTPPPQAPLPSSNSATPLLPNELSAYPAHLLERLRSLPPEALILGFSVGGVSALGTTAVYRRYFRRLPSSGWVTPDILKTKKRWVKGYVTKVGDADGFRLYHTPGIGWRWPLKFRSIPLPKNQKDSMKEKTLGIRIAGADAPEGPFFGGIAQEGYSEARQWFTDRVDGRFVYCQLHSKDQYGRLVASVHLPRRFLPGLFFRGPSISIDMIRAGWAVVYEETGAEYGPYSLSHYKSVEADALSARRGLWVNGKLAESPAEYKKRLKAVKAAKAAKSGNEDEDEVEEPAEKAEQRAKVKVARRGFIRRFLGL